MILPTLTSLYLPLEQLARAGGGGSGGGGGGSGGSGGLEGIAAIGYFTMHFVGAMLRRVFEKNEALKTPLHAVGWIIASLAAVFWVMIWPGWGILVAIGGFLGMPSGLYNWLAKVKTSKYLKGKLKKAASNDKIWNEESLVAHAKATFIKYQQDWSDFNQESIKSYTTPGYYYKSSLLLRILADMKRKNIMSEINIKQAVLSRINDSEDNTQDQFQVGIVAQAKDEIVSLADPINAKVLHTNKSEFVEYWVFQRSGDTWKLADINQATARQDSINPLLRQFAYRQNYTYSPDMGWLFIPERGQLFKGSKFGVSDINNHIAGMHNGVVIQMYSYIKNPNTQTKPYVIAQLNVPKSYGNIVVRRDKFLQMGISGLEKVETEWTKFNKKYEVYATKPEQVTSFELLNPTFMEMLEALPFEVNIEVVDNVIYLYAPESKTDTQAFSTMLDVMHKAFEELKL